MLAAGVSRQPARGISVSALLPINYSCTVAAADRGGCANHIVHITLRAQERKKDGGRGDRERGRERKRERSRSPPSPLYHNFYFAKKQVSMSVGDFKARLDINPRHPNNELLNIVDAPNEIRNLPIEVWKTCENWIGPNQSLCPNRPVEEAFYVFVVCDWSPTSTRNNCRCTTELVWIAVPVSFLFLEDLKENP